MARTIRLNTSTGAAAGGGAAGLTTADVERVVEDKARWILDYEKDYGNNIPNWMDPLIPDIDFDNCFSYKVRDPGLGQIAAAARDGHSVSQRYFPISGTVITAARVLRLDMASNSGWS